MPGRITPLVNGNYYHIFNRGSDKRDLFIQSSDYSRFIKTLYYYHFTKPKVRFSIYNKSKLDFTTSISDTKLVEIISYCLMPNHFHLMVKQLEEDGISKFISKLSNSYTKYFNTKYKRTGPLLQGAFKAVLVDNDEQFIHLSRYIHLNPLASKITDHLDKYLWSSFFEYKLGSLFCSTDQILRFFKSSDEYLIFLEDQIQYSQSLEILKHHLIDED